jgi:hypothetical protein
LGKSDEFFFDHLSTGELRVSENELSGSFPSQLESLTSLEVAILGSNSFNGKFHETFKDLPSLGTNSFIRPILRLLLAYSRGRF